MSGREHILTIDSGTQSVRALIFDPRGSLVAKSQIHIDRTRCSSRNRTDRVRDREFLGTPEP